MHSQANLTPIPTNPSPKNHKLSPTQIWQFLNKESKMRSQENDDFGLKEISEGRRKIKGKMIVKLLGWMEKLYRQTL